jgi:hypothetical protein
MRIEVQKAAFQYIKVEPNARRFNPYQKQLQAQLSDVKTAHKKRAASQKG